ncbi:hypothetical protein TNCT_575831 [Trichonephila clavata]|uniref:Uncharacterized protein n=1 Tax=Trichonephila clavata TaxID=2740835 RepID=A0A8X6HAZ8_TRICU|nr:hypothetical protein TNCT_575831 [Trichonephila clavata]
MTHKTTRSAKKKSKDNLSENKFKMQYSQSQLNVIQAIERPYERDQFTTDINEPTTSYGIKYIGEGFHKSIQILVQRLLDTSQWNLIFMKRIKIFIQINYRRHLRTNKWNLPREECIHKPLRINELSEKL